MLTLISRLFREWRKFSVVVMIGLLANAAVAKSEWRKVETEYFTVYSQTSERETRHWAVKLEQFRMCMEQLFPLHAERLEPVTVIIFKKAKEFHQYQQAITDNPYDVLGVFHRNLGRNTIVMVGDSDEEDMGKVVFHEATHWYFSGESYQLPAWVSEGTAEVFAMFRIEGGEAVFGGSNPGRYHTLDGYGMFYIQNVMNMPKSIAHSVGGVRGSLFYAQAWLLMNYILAEDEMGGFERLKLYLEKTRSGMPLDIAFREIYGMTYDELDERLDNYFDKEWFKSIRVPIGQDIATVRGTESGATESDVDLALAVLLLQQYRRDEALELIEGARAQSPEDPRVYEVLAVLAAQEGDYALRDNHFLEAAKRGTRNPMVYYYAYRSRVGSYRRKEAAAIHADQETLRLAIQSLRSAIEINSEYRQAYELIAEIFGSVKSPTKADYELMKEAALLYPDEPVFEVAMASYEMKNGKPRTAKKRLDKVLAEGGDFQATSYARRVLLRLKARIDLHWMRRAYEDRDTEKMYRFAKELNKAPIFEEERVEVNAMKESLNLLLYIERAEKAIEEKQWGMAEVLLDEIANEGVPDEFSKRYDAAVERLEARRDR